jgi:uncharacterized protein YecE (DUF72 family)
MYVRGHGPGRRYRGQYRPNTLSAWKRRLAAFARSRDVYVYFDNDQKSAAPKDAKRLLSLLSS